MLRQRWLQQRKQIPSRVQHRRQISGRHRDEYIFSGSGPTTRQLTVTVVKKVDASSVALKQAMNSSALLQGVIIEVYQPGSTA